MALLLIILGISAVFMVLLMAMWIVGNLPVDQTMNILRHPMDISSNWQHWMSAGYGEPGFRYLVSILFHDPMILAVILFSLTMAIAGLVLLCRFFARLNKEQKRLNQRLENSSLQIERKARKIRLAEDETSNHEKQIIPLMNGTELDSTDAPQKKTAQIIKTDSSKDEFVLLDVAASLRKKENDDLKFALHLMEEGQKTRQAYENVLHQASSKLSSLYFLLDDLAQHPEIAQNDAILADLNDSETVLDECTRLLKSFLHTSVYEEVRLDYELLLSLNQKRSELERKNLNTNLKLNPVSISGNVLWLRQIFETLLANAIEFSPENGCIGIRLDLENSQIRIQFENTLERTTIASQPSKTRTPMVSSRRYDTTRSGHFGIGHDLVNKVLKDHQGHLETREENGIFQAIVFLPYCELDHRGR